MRWDTVLGEDMEDEKLCKVTGGDSVMGQDKWRLFGQPVNDNQDGGITQGWGKLLYEVHGD